MNVSRYSSISAITPFSIGTCIIWKIIYKKFSEPSNHVSEKHIILKVKSKENKKVLKLSKKKLILLILMWKTEKESVTGFSTQS